MWIEIVLFLLLGVCAVSDGIKKEIPLVPVWAGILFAVLLHVAGAFGEEKWPAVVLSVLPGAAFWLISLMTAEKVGYGDGWILVMIGLFTGLRRCFLILLAVRKISTDREVPFVPFLLMGMGVVIWL